MQVILEARTARSIIKVAKGGVGEGELVQLVEQLNLRQWNGIVKALFHWSSMGHCLSFHLTRCEARTGRTPLVLTGRPYRVRMEGWMGMPQQQTNSRYLPFESMAFLNA